MKKLIALFGLVFMTAVAIADVGPVGRSTSLDGAGSVQSGSQEKWFIYVKNGSGDVVSDGSVVILDVSADDGYTVTTSSTAGDVPHCVMAKEDASVCAASKLCRCQTYGLHSGLAFDSTNELATAGNLVFLSENNAGYVQGEAEGSYAASDVAIGVFYDSASASGDVEGFIKLR